jgi:hypothetical protein
MVVGLAVQAAVPVPETPTFTVAAELVTATLPLTAPTVVGENVTDTVQLAPAASDEPHVFVWEYPLGAATVNEVAAMLPLFVRVKLWALELCPSMTLL